MLAWDWLGATVVTVLVAIVCWATRGLVTAVSGSGGEIAYLVPAVLVLMVMGQYVHPVPLCVGLGLALVGANPTSGWVDTPWACGWACSWLLRR